MNYSLNNILKLIFHDLCKVRVNAVNEVNAVKVVNAVNALHFSALLIDDFTKHS
jgi:hypothetical protein